MKRDTQSKYIEAISRYAEGTATLEEIRPYLLEMEQVLHEERLRVALAAQDLKRRRLERQQLKDQKKGDTLTRPKYPLSRRP